MTVPYLAALIMVDALLPREPISEGCHCQRCDPDQHADCFSDCSRWDCGSSWACCNGDCDDCSA